MSMKKSDVKSDDAVKPAQPADRSALAECAMVLASTLLLGCKTRGQLEARERKFAVADSELRGRTGAERKTSRSHFTYSPFGSDLRTARAGVR
jgi:hypothetical protein